MATVRCEGCGYAGPPETFPPTMNPYHDFRCPKCGTTEIDTSELAGPGYAYGKGNVLETPKPEDEGAQIGLQNLAWFTGPKCQRAACGCWEREGRPIKGGDPVPPFHEDCDCLLVDAVAVESAKADGAAGRLNQYNLLKAARYRAGLEMDGVVDGMKISPAAAALKRGSERRKADDESPEKVKPLETMGVGRFYISLSVAEDQPEQVMRVLSRCIVTRCELQFHRKEFEYIAYSPDFERPRQPYGGPAHVPEYVWELDTESGKLQAKRSDTVFPPWEGPQKA